MSGDMGFEYIEEGKRVEVSIGQDMVTKWC